MMKHVYRNLKLDNGEQNSNSILISYFIYGRGNEIQRSNMGVLRSLLQNTLPKCQKTLEELAEVFENRNLTRGNCGEKWNWLEDELKNYLESALFFASTL